MKTTVVVILTVFLSACSDTTTQQRFTNCVTVAERVALDTTSPEALSALAIFSDEDEKSEARAQAESELETQRAVFMTAAHEQRMVLAFTKVNRFAERYIDAYGKCREIDSGEG
jgi:hypothetical protein